MWQQLKGFMICYSNNSLFSTFLSSSSSSSSRTLVPGQQKVHRGTGIQGRTVCSMTTPVRSFMHWPQPSCLAPCSFSREWPCWSCWQPTGILGNMHSLTYFSSQVIFCPVEDSRSRCMDLSSSSVRQIYVIPSSLVYFLQCTCVWPTPGQDLITEHQH